MSRDREKPQNQPIEEPESKVRSGDVHRSGLDESRELGQAFQQHGEFRNILFQQLSLCQLTLPVLLGHTQIS